MDYNDAVAASSNELTLLNILRAERGMPLHFTAISQMNGGITVKTAASLSSVQSGRGKTLQSTNEVDGGATAATKATVQQTIAHAAPTLTPSFTGEVDAAPSLTLQVLDDQKFSRGISTAIPLSTVQNFIAQGYDNALIVRLMVERIDLTVTDPKSKHPSTYRYDNAPSGSDATRFVQLTNCSMLSEAASPAPAKRLAPVSRLEKLKLEDLAKLDGSALDLEVVPPNGRAAPGERVSPGQYSSSSGAAPSDPKITDNPGNDKNVYVVRPSTDQLIDFEPQEGGLCTAVRALWRDYPVDRLGWEATSFPTDPNGVPEWPLKDRGHVWFTPVGSTTPEVWTASRRIYFRSVESVIRYLGDYLRATAVCEHDAVKPADVQCPVYSVQKGRPSPAFSKNYIDPGSVADLPLIKVLPVDHVEHPAVVATINGERFAIDANDRQSLTVLAIVEELINLQKSADDRPITVPVRVLN